MCRLSAMGFPYRDPGATKTDRNVDFTYTNIYIYQYTDWDWFIVQLKIILYLIKSLYTVTKHWYSKILESIKNMSCYLSEIVLVPFLQNLGVIFQRYPMVMCINPFLNCVTTKRRIPEM